MIRLAQFLLVAGVGGQLLVAERGVEFATCLGLHLIASAGWLYLCFAMLRGDYRPSFLEALGLALAIRLLALFLSPALSDDIYRYLFEGNLVLSGVNPYLTAPDSAAAMAYHGPYFELINNQDIPAAYPPAVQYGLALGRMLSADPIGMKLLFGLFDLGVFVLLWQWLPALGVSRQRAIIYGLCPLMALEFAGEGHSDSLAVFFMIAACMCSTNGRSWSAGACLALATAGKLLPIVLLPFLWRRGKGSGLAFLLVLFALYLPFIPFQDPFSMFAGTIEYGARWRSNDSLFALIHTVTEYVHGLGWLGSLEVQRAAKFPLAALGVGLLAWAYRRRLPPERVALCFFLFFVAFAPTLHPWYLGLLLPFLCLYPKPAWLMFFGTVYLAYHALPGWLLQGEWQEQTWIKVCEYSPFYLGFLVARSPVTSAEE